MDEYRDRTEEKTDEEIFMEVVRNGYQMTELAMNLLAKREDEYNYRHRG